MTIGIDIDDTITKTNEKALEIIKRENYEKVTFWEELNDILGFIHKHYKEIVKTVELYEDAREVLELIHKKGHKIIFITQRTYQKGADTEEDTINYLKKNNIPYDKIYFAKRNKLETCLKENVDVFIDDKENTLKPINEAGIKCIKMRSHEYNKSQFETIDNWKQIKEILKLN